MALPHVDFGREALNIAADGSELPAGHGAFLPMGWSGVLAALPFAVWLYLAIEKTPLAAEESVDPVRDRPRGILLALATLILTAFLIVVINPAVEGVGAHTLAQSGEPVLDGFRALLGGASADILLLNMAVFGAMLSYLSRAAAFLVLRRDYPRLPHPFPSPWSPWWLADHRDLPGDAGLPGAGSSVPARIVLGGRLA